MAVPVPSPKLKVTVPVGVPAGDETVARMVTVPPDVEGSGVEVTVVVDTFLLSVWVSVPVEAEKVASPL